MTSQDLVAFNDLMTAVSETYRQPLSALALEIYWETLKHHAFDQVRRSVMAHIAHAERGKFMPKPADIVFMLNRGMDSSVWAGAL